MNFAITRCSIKLVLNLNVWVWTLPLSLIPYPYKDISVEGKKVVSSSSNCFVVLKNRTCKDLFGCKISKHFSYIFAHQIIKQIMRILINCSVQVGLVFLKMDGWKSFIDWFTIYKLLAQYHLKISHQYDLWSSNHYQLKFNNLNSTFLTLIRYFIPV